VDVLLDDPAASSPSLLNLRLPSTEGGGGGRASTGGGTAEAIGVSSSESLKVKSITTGPDGTDAAEFAVAWALAALGADSSRLTSCSSSESEESPMVIAPSLLLTLVDGGEAGSDFAVLWTPCSLIQDGEPY